MTPRHLATRGHVAAEPLDKTLADTLPHVETETLDDRLDDVKGKALVVVVLADVAAKVEAKTLDKTEGQIETEALINLLPKCRQVKTLDDTVT